MRIGRNVFWIEVRGVALNSCINRRHCARLDDDDAVFRPLVAGAHAIDGGPQTVRSEIAIATAARRQNRRWKGPGGLLAVAGGGAAACGGVSGAGGPDPGPGAE